MAKINPTLAANLDILREAVQKNWDGIIIIDGVEGVAKTTLAADICYYLDSDYNLGNVVFVSEQFNDFVLDSRPAQAVHWDEFIFGGLSTEHATKNQNALIKMFTTIRKKRLFIVLCVPYYFMLRPYFAILRSRCLIHCYTPDGLNRGFFAFYSYARKMQLYHKAIRSRNWQYKTVQPNFHGKFKDSFGKYWDANEYDMKKEASIRGIYPAAGGNNKRHDDKIKDIMANLGVAP